MDCFAEEELKVLARKNTNCVRVNTKRKRAAKHCFSGKRSKTFFFGKKIKKISRKIGNLFFRKKIKNLFPEKKRELFSGKIENFFSGKIVNFFPEKSVTFFPTKNRKLFFSQAKKRETFPRKIYNFNFKKIYI
jgi:hypothetical protein